MGVREVRVRGPECLALATSLLQRIRLADGEAGLWDAADVQWWWRKPRRSDAVDQWFLLDGAGPVAAAMLTDWGELWQCDPLLLPGTSCVSVGDVWRRGMESIERQHLDRVETLLRDDDDELRSLALRSGFVATEDRSGIAWLDAASRRPVAPPPGGFMVCDRSQDPGSPHPMRPRNGADVETRLRECSLYDPALDLAVRAPNSEIAGYALFWFDPATSVGMLEPMRIETAFQRRGLARSLLTAGLDRLVRRGARRVKVGWATAAARALYEGSGFATTATAREYRWTT